MSHQNVLSELTKELQVFLSGEKLVLLGTIDAEGNSPSVSAISWVKSRDERTVRFAVSSNSRIVSNLRSNPNAVLTIIGLGTVYSINGKVLILEETMEDVSLKLAKLEFVVEKIYNSMFWGSKITAEPAFEKTYNVEKAKKLDEQVYSALMK